MTTSATKWPRFFVALVLSVILRFVPFRPPNFEPLLSMGMPISHKYGLAAGALFPFCAIVLFDVFMDKIGIWTLATATVYGILGMAACFYFKKKNPKRLDYARFALWGTLFYDAATGLTLGPIFFGQSFMSALVGQIPFTVLHIMGNVVLAYFLSPLMARMLAGAASQVPLIRVNRLSYEK